MTESVDYKLIKRHYGEKMAQLCRSLFPTILEHPGILFQILSNYFAYNRDLFYDISVNDAVSDFKSYIYGLYRDKYESPSEKKETIIEDPFELMKKAGYTLYECNSEKDIQSFRKYYKRFDNENLPEYVEGSELPYRDGEELCTFDGGRLKRCMVFFAVKDNVDEIKRENFTRPKRQDEYGTSVISIQFSRGELNDISIKNRYNHTVRDPDATFSNDLENIIAGLTEAFIHKYNLNLISSAERDFELPGYVSVEGKFYKYNFERGNVYFCPDNIIIDNFNVVQYDKARYIVFDGFVLDLATKTLEEYFPKSPRQYFRSCLPEVIGPIGKVVVSSDKGTNKKTITINDQSVIVLDKNNCIISFTNNEVEKVGDLFLSASNRLESVELNNVKEIGDYFCSDARRLSKISIPNAQFIGSRFAWFNKSLTSLYLPKVERVDDWFLSYNNYLQNIDAPNLVSTGSHFLENSYLNGKINLPVLSRMGSISMGNVTQEELCLPSLIEVGESSFWSAQVSDYYFPQLTAIPCSFLYGNRHIRSFSAPLATQICECAFARCDWLEEINFPNVTEVGDGVLYMLPHLKRVTIKNFEAFCKLDYDRSSLLEKLVIVEETRKEEEEDERAKNR